MICLHDEEIDFEQPLELFDPDATWKRKVYTNIEAKELMVPIFQQGKLVYQVPDLQASRAYCQRQVDSLWDEVKRSRTPTTTSGPVSKAVGYQAVPAAQPRDEVRNSGGRRKYPAAA